jgi:hypothetical protein
MILKSQMIKTPDSLVCGAQMRAARALLRWSAVDLAREAKLGVATIRRAELIDGPVQTTAANAAAIRAALEAAGVSFISENGGGIGVRLARKHDRSHDDTTARRKSV